MRNMAHLKRYVMPKSWPVPVKAETFIIRPCAGPHALRNCMPLQVVIRNVLGVAETAAEARKIMNEGKVMVDKRKVKDPKFPVGLMDIVEIQGSGKHYLVNVNEKGLSVEEVKSNQTGHKLCMIIGKKTLKKGKHQLNLHDGRNILIDKDNKYNVRDTILISLPDQKIVGHFKLEKGSPAFIYSGKNMGARGTITKVKTRKSMTEKSTVELKSDKKEIETLKEYVFVGEPGNIKVSK